MAGGDSGGFDFGNIAGWMRDSILEGENATNALDTFREMGGAVRTEWWYQMYGEVYNSMASAPAVAALDPDVLPNAGDYGVWEAGQGGRYATQVVQFLRDLETGEIITSQYTHMTVEPHTIDEAQAAAQTDFGNVDTLNAYGQAWMGALATGLWQTTPFEG